MDDPRYKTGRWKKLRAAVLRRDPLCAYCRARGRAEAATTVDHVIPVARGGALTLVPEKQGHRVCDYLALGVVEESGEESEG